MAQNLQGLSYEACSANTDTIFPTGIIYSSFWDKRHYTPAGCCYITRIYEIRLQWLVRNLTLHSVIRTTATQFYSVVLT